MKIRKLIATATLAAAALAGTATGADAFNPQPEPPAAQQHQASASNPTTTFETQASRGGTAEIEFVEVAGGSGAAAYGGRRSTYLKIELAKG